MTSIDPTVKKKDSNDLKKEIKKLKEELKEKEDKLLRSYADFQNLRKRTTNLRSKKSSSKM